MKKSFLLLLFLEIILIIISVTFLVPKFYTSTKIEAINMDLSNYKFDYYLGKNVVKTAGDVGEAMYVFKGMPAFYDIKVAYVDEDDGNSAYLLTIGGNKISTWKADANPSKDCLYTKIIHNVNLSYGCEIKIQGIRNKGESARLANIEISYDHGMSFGTLIQYAFKRVNDSVPVVNQVILAVIIAVFIAANIIILLILKHKNFEKAYSLSKVLIPQSAEAINIKQDIESYDEAAASSTTEAFDDSSLYTESDNELQSLKTSEVPSSIEDLQSMEFPSPLIVDQMISYLNSRYTDSNFSVQEMSEKFNLSLNYLSSFFKDQTGQNIIYYITNLRIEKAKQLLTSTDMPIKNVAENSGYYNVSSFIRRFKSIVGITPGEYRSNNRTVNI